MWSYHIFNVFDHINEEIVDLSPKIVSILIIYKLFYAIYKYYINQGSYRSGLCCICFNIIRWIYSLQILYDLPYNFDFSDYSNFTLL